ncbi:MAG TPA: hypothetical protein VEA15_02655 [Caulobacteraceae bacterium]|nr:hypothetical protein [Caulobacteraceae bacterium]
MPLTTLLLAGPAKIGAVLVGATLVGVGGYAAYDRYYGPAPYNETLPLLPAAQVGLFEPAPPVAALPIARPAPVGYVNDPVDSYAWAERAAALSYAFADVPPDYGYAYDDTEYWAWEADGWVLDVEPVYGGDRYYYYGPHGDYPFFVRDAGYGYGFDDGVLVVIYDPYGRVMPVDFVRERADWAGRYLYRAAALREARLDAARAERRWRVDRDRWLARQDRLYDSQARLQRAALQQPQWQAYRQRVDDRDRRYFAQERRERMQDLREARADRRQDLRQARRSSDAPPALTVAERRQMARGDELVLNRQRLQDVQARQDARAGRLAERAEARTTRRALARDDTPRAETRREMLAARQAARTDRQQAYRDARAEQRAAVAANPTREGRAEARRDLLAARAAARAERKQAYRDVQPGRAAAAREAPRVRAATAERRERAAETRTARLTEQRAARAERAARPSPRADRAVERRAERRAERPEPQRVERIAEHREARPQAVERRAEARPERRAERPARVQARREDREAGRAARQQAREERRGGRD